MLLCARAKYVDYYRIYALVGSVSETYNHYTLFSKNLFCIIEYVHKQEVLARTNSLCSLDISLTAQKT
jgi:hypothetical protein